MKYFTFTTRMRGEGTFTICHLETVIKSTLSENLAFLLKCKHWIMKSLALNVNKVKALLYILFLENRVTTLFNVRDIELLNCLRYYRLKQEELKSCQKSQQLIFMIRFLQKILSYCLAKKLANAVFIN
ncbi:uncharacterized protein LOC118767296 [Octopus sinensis]|uniref:Uncharacterized protein LOC118767296 n=1 Tax=Octopus sinensis TaxID=2607531 RepID=A0A7E6FIG4_9MOLL|nr:uncharacterized protein LOC118767296 [Octopus sinensis]